MYLEYSYSVFDIKRFGVESLKVSGIPLYNKCAYVSSALSDFEFTAPLYKYSDWLNWK